MKKRALEWVAVGVALALVGGAAFLAFFISGGVSARPSPGRVETFVARTARDLAIGWHASHEPNPVPGTDEAIAEARAHFADHCASCHANDGSGNVDIGRGLYPRAPDMRLPPTQNLEDHELFYIIENGIRLTGMPAWSTGTPEGEEASWKLVHFIRHLPQITPEEVEQMEAMNPRSPADIRQEIEAERFLRGDDPAPIEPPQPHGH